MWKQPHFIHRSGNLTDKHFDCVRIWSWAAFIRTHTPVSRPLLAQRLHPVHRPPRTAPREPSSSLFCSLSESVKFYLESSLGWIGEKDGITRLSAANRAKCWSDVFKRSADTRHARPHTFAFYKFPGILASDPYYCLQDCSDLDLDGQMERKHFIFTSFAVCNKNWWVFAFQPFTKYIF